ncbi:MAG: GEVED domain-containing protein [Bacteroidia bacterium]|nr:GEVED domain-containing protein [Bacteroidia bacterium]
MRNFIFSRLRSWRLALTVAVVSLGLASSATAQVNGYTATTGTGATWENLSGGTIIMSASNDDIPSVVQNIGFNFNFGGTVYTQYSVSPDGFLKFGGIAASSQYTNTNSATNQPKLFPWWNDLALGGSGLGGEIRYQVFGTAPNRKLVIQWYVTIPRSTSAAANAQFQVTLSEGTNTIQYVYGSPNTATDGMSGASIGISTSTTDFISLDAARVPSTTVFTTSITNYNGTNYPYVLFTPPPCQDPPTAGTAVSSVPKACANVAFSLNLTGQSGGVQTYQWQSSPNGSSWSDISGATSVPYSATQTSATYYRCKVTCGSTVSSVSVFVDMEAPNNCYCTPTYSNACTSDDKITNFTFSNINNTSDCSPQNYNYYSGLTANVYTGLSYPTSFTFGYAGQGCKVWVDFNDNGSFEDAGEMVFSLQATSSVSGTIVIPGNAPAGVHRMRVRCVWNTLTFTSCSAQSYGETEDYNINIVAGSPCVDPPTAGTANSTLPKVCSGSSFSVYLTGNSNGLNQTYQWQSSPNGSSWSNITGATDTFRVATQTSATYYRCNVTCGSTVSSVSVFVDMEAPNNCYCTPTYSTGCTDDDDIINFTFSNINNTSTCSPGPSYYTYYSGLTANAAAGSSYPVSVTFGNNTYSEGCKVWVDFNDNGSFEDAGEMVFSLQATSSVSGTIVIPGNAPAGVHRMRVRCVYGNLTFTSCDNQSYGETEDYKINITIPACPAPYALAATNISLTTADLTWSGSGQGSYILEWGPLGFVQGTGTTVNPATSPVSLSGLNPGTDYSFYVRQDCGIDGLSTVTGPSNFQTQTPGESCVTASTIATYQDSASIVITVINSGASQDGPNANCSSGSGNVPDDDRWVKFIAPNTTNKLRVRSYPGNNSDWVMEVWDGCPGSGSVIACSDDGPGNNLMPLTDLCGLTPGNAYYVRLWSWATGLVGRTCSLAIFETTPCPVPPPNDQCINATMLNVNPSCVSTNGTTIAASSGANPSASCNMYGAKNDVWYKFNTGCNTNIGITVATSTGTHGFNLNSDCSGTQVGSNCNTSQGTLNYTGLVRYTDYYVRVWSIPGSEGNFTVCVTGTLGVPPIITSTTPDSRIGAGVVNLGATSSFGSVRWYDQLIGGTLLFTGNSYSQVISNTTTYYVEAFGDCASPTRTAVTATVMLPYVVNTMTAINITHNGASLNWTYNGNTPCDSVKVYIKKSIANSWFKIETLSGAPLNFQRQQLQANTNYLWQCQTFYNGTGYWGPTSTFTTAGICASFTGTNETNVTDSAATLNWLTSGTPDSVKVLYRRTGSNNWASVTTTNAYVALTGLWQATNYEWKAQTYCNGVINTTSNLDNFTTLPTCEIPTNLANAYYSPTQRKLSWDLISGASSYNIQWRLQGNPNWISIMNNVDTTRNLGGLSESSTYEWRVRTNCNGSYGPWSSINTFTHVNTKTMGATALNAVVYPIPTRNGYVSVRFQGEAGMSYNILVTDVTGRVIATQNGTAELSNDILVNLNGASSGVYNLSLRCGESTFNHKVVVE